MELDLLKYLQKQIITYCKRYNNEVFFYKKYPSEGKTSEGKERQTLGGESYTVF